jgi:hypothetical protein
LNAHAVRASRPSLEQVSGGENLQADTDQLVRG